MRLIFILFLACSLFSADDPSAGNNLNKQVVVHIRLSSDSIKPGLDYKVDASFHNSTKEPIYVNGKSVFFEILDKKTGNLVYGPQRRNVGGVLLDAAEGTVPPGGDLSFAAYLKVPWSIKSEDDYVVRFCLKTPNNGLLQSDYLSFSSPTPYMSDQPLLKCLMKISNLENTAEGTPDQALGNINKPEALIRALEANPASDYAEVVLEHLYLLTGPEESSSGDLIQASKLVINSGGNDDALNLARCSLAYAFIIRNDYEAARQALTSVDGKYACFKNSLQKSMKEKIGSSP